MVHADNLSMFIYIHSYEFLLVLDPPPIFIATPPLY